MDFCNQRELCFFFSWVFCEEKNIPILITSCLSKPHTVTDKSLFVACWHTTRSASHIRSAYSRQTNRQDFCLIWTNSCLMPHHMSFMRQKKKNQNEPNERRSSHRETKIFRWKFDTIFLLKKVRLSVVFSRYLKKKKNQLTNKQRDQSLGMRDVRRKRAIVFVDLFQFRFLYFFLSKMLLPIRESATLEPIKMSQKKSLSTKSQIQLWNNCRLWLDDNQNQSFFHSSFFFFAECGRTFNKNRQRNRPVT